MNDHRKSRPRFKGRSRARFGLSRHLTEQHAGAVRVTRSSARSAWPAGRSVTLPNLGRLLISLWVVNLPFGFAPEEGLAPGIVWNHAIVGAAVAALAVMRMLVVREVGFFRVAHLCLGLWLTLSPWILDFVEVDPTFTLTIAGGTLITLLATWSLVR